MTKKPEIYIYSRVGSEKQIGKQLSEVRAALNVEEQNMKDLAAQFLTSSERYNALRATQRSLTAQLFTIKQEREADKKRG